jgi:putative salt-induced outer membrane protein
VTHKHPAISFVMLACACLLVPSTVRAEEPVAPAEGVGTGVTQATTGSAELDDQGKFAKAGSEEVPEGEEHDQTTLTLTAGGLAATGNANSAAFTGSALFRVRRKKHQFGADFIGNYGQAEDDTETWVPNVSNVQGRVRYDFFFHKRISAFLMTTARYDPFQGLEFRLNVDPGFAFYIFKAKGDRFGGAHDLWTEVGYDFQYDVRCSQERGLSSCTHESLTMPPPTPEDMMPSPIARTFVNHSARLFGGYQVAAKDDRVKFLTGVEYLQSFLNGQDNGFDHSLLYKITWDSAIVAPVFKGISLSLSFSLRYDKTLAGEASPLDTMTAANLVVSVGDYFKKKSKKTAPAAAPAPAPAATEPAAVTPAPVASSPAATSPAATTTPATATPAETTTAPAATPGAAAPGDAAAAPASAPAGVDPSGTTPGRQLAFVTHLGI